VILRRGYTYGFGTQCKKSIDADASRLSHENISNSRQDQFRKLWANQIPLLRKNQCDLEFGEIEQH
jgi:hypothetical protein